MIIKADGSTTNQPANQASAGNTNTNTTEETTDPLFSLCDSTSSAMPVPPGLNKDAPVFTPGNSTGPCGLTGSAPPPHASGSGSAEYIVTAGGGLLPSHQQVQPAPEGSFVLTSATPTTNQPSQVSVVGNAAPTLVVVPAATVAFPQQVPAPQQVFTASSSSGPVIPAPSFMASGTVGSQSGGAASHSASTSNMSLQNQMLAQFSPQQPGAFVSSNPSNVAGRRIILGGSSSGGPSPSGSIGGNNFSSGGFNGSGSASPALGGSSASPQSLARSGGASVSSSGNNFSGSNYAAAAIGDTENDIKSLLPPAGGKLRDPNDKGPKQCIVKFLAPQVTEQELRQLFQQFGPVEYSRMIYDANTGSSKGYGFVYFYKSGDAAEAVKGLDSFELYGRYLRVGFAIPQRQPPAPNQPSGSPTSPNAPGS